MNFLLSLANQKFSDNIEHTIILVHIFFCWFMTGLIWLVQVLVYPNFRLIREEDLQFFHQFHLRRITWLVGPVMCFELLSGIWLYCRLQHSIYLFNLVLIFGIWILTGFVSIPFHNQLTRNTKNFLIQEKLNQKSWFFLIRFSKNNLIWTNWPRTVIWSVRAIFWLFQIQLK